MTPPQIIHAACGSPSVAGCAPQASVCYLCAATMARGMLVTDWMGENFADQHRSRSPSSSRVCEACCFISSRTSPVPGRPAKEGKKFGANFRNLAHMWDERGYINASKGEKLRMREFLARDHAGPWFATIPESGQKHALPFAPMNGPWRAGVVLYEEALIMVPDDQSLVGEMTDMLTGGVTKEEIERGEYRFVTLREMRAEVRAFEDANGAARNSGWFSLALYLAQRDEEKSARRIEEAKARNKSRGDAARAPRSVSRGARRTAAAELLGDSPSSDASGSPNDDQRERVGDAGPAQATDPGPAQRGLPVID